MQQGAGCGVSRLCAADHTARPAAGPGSVAVGRTPAKLDIDIAVAGGVVVAAGAACGHCGDEVVRCRGTGLVARGGYMAWLVPRGSHLAWLVPRGGHLAWLVPRGGHRVPSGGGNWNW